MSLRTRVLILFVGFAVLPILLLGIGDYLQSIQALRAVIEARSEALASQTARDVEREYMEARAALRAVGEVLALGGAADSALEAGLPDGVTFDSVRVRAADGATRTVRADGTPEYPACGTPEPVVIRVALPDPAVETVEGYTTVVAVAARAPAMTARLGREGFTRIVDGATERVLLDSNCLHAALTEADSGGGDGVDGGPSAPPDETFTTSTAEVAGPGWQIAVHSSDAEFFAPFRTSRLLYVGLVLLVLVLAAAVFLALTQSSFRSLRALTAAADEVELGNMRPWIPPPGDDDVGRLALAFRKMTDRLEDSLRRSEVNQKLAAVGELASYLSHEIRNPLSSIRLGLQTLHRDLSAGFIPPDASRIIEIALNEVKRLDGVVRTVLEVGRDPHQRNGDATCDAHATITEAVDVILPRARAREIAIEFEPRAEHSIVVGEPEGLRSVWINLIVNALDAVQDQEDGRIRITTSAGGDGRELHVRVADNGPGVPAYAVDSIFEPFFTTKEKGNGIGLATASRTLEAAGGSITYEPLAAGAGAVFMVRLRRADVAQPTDRHPNQHEEPALPSRGAA